MFVSKWHIMYMTCNTHTWPGKHNPLRPSGHKLKLELTQSIVRSEQTNPAKTFTTKVEDKKSSCHIPPSTLLPTQATCLSIKHIVSKSNIHSCAYHSNTDTVQVNSVCVSQWTAVDKQWLVIWYRCYSSPSTVVTHTPHRGREGGEGDTWLYANISHFIP